MAVRSGREYVDALRDGREVWHAGKRIEDVTAHPGFTGTIGTLADLYDRQVSAEDRDTMTAAREGGRISYSYLPPVDAEELRAKRGNIELWSRETFGQMGRYPEFCAELVVGLLDFADTLAAHDPRWGGNARAYYGHCIAGDLCLTHALTDQFYDHSRRVSEQRDPDLVLHIVGETSEGPVVRGLRNLATLAPLSDEALVYPIRPRDADEPDYAIAFAIPMNAPGLKIICRDLYAEHADPERFPLTKRFDEVDATLVFDDVVVPWERVFAYRAPELVAGFHRNIQTWAQYATMVRLITKLETFLGVAQLLTEWSGRHKAPHSQIRLAAFIQDLEILRDCVEMAENRAHRTAGGHWAPLLSPSYRVYSIEASDRAEHNMESLLTSSLVLTGGASDLASGELGPLVDRYFRGCAPSTREHLRLLAVAADLVMTPFGKRGQLYERLQSGETDNMRRRLHAQFRERGGAERLLAFINREW